MMEQYSLEGKPIRNATCTVKTDDGCTIQIRTSGSAAKALIDGFMAAMRKTDERGRWEE